MGQTSTHLDQKPPALEMAVTLPQALPLLAATGQHQIDRVWPGPPPVEVDEHRLLLPSPGLKSASLLAAYPMMGVDTDHMHRLDQRGDHRGPLIRCRGLHHEYPIESDSLLTRPHQTEILEPDRRHPPVGLHQPSGQPHGHRPGPVTVDAD